MWHFEGEKKMAGSIFKRIFLNRNFCIQNFIEVYPGDQIANEYALVKIVRRQAILGTHDGLLLRIASLDSHELIFVRYELPAERLSF